MKYLAVPALIIIALITLYTSLEEKNPTNPNSNHTVKYTERRIDGVTYLFSSHFNGYQGYGYMSAKFNPDSTVQTGQQEQNND